MVILAWDNLDPNSDAFTLSNMVIPYEGGLSHQYLSKIAKNTSWLYGNVGQQKSLINESFLKDAEKDYDTDIDYTNKYIQYWCTWNSSIEGVFTFPLYWAEVASTDPVVMQLTTSYQNLMAGDVVHTAAFEIKALATGGIRIKGTNVLALSEPFYLLFTFHRLNALTAT